MNQRRPTAALLAWSLIGLFVGHQAAYLVVYRDPALVVQALADSGHGWMWIAPLLAASAALTALVVGFRGTGPVMSFRWRFAALAMIQSATFLALEICERMTGPEGATDLVRHLLAGSGWLVLTLGLAFQVVTALLLALASRAVERIAAAIRRRRRRMPRIATPAMRRTGQSTTLPVGLGLVRPWPPRAPPART